MRRTLSISVMRSRMVAVGAVVAASLASGGLMTASAAVSSGERAVFVPITPCRVMDTRPAPATVGSRSTPLGAAQTHTISVLGANGNCTIPNDAVGLSLNVTAVGPTQDSYLTVFPSGAVQPTASNLNYSANQAPVPNAVTSDIGVDGKISFFNSAGSVNLLADIVGYFVDHNHDDRYFTKAQVDASLALKANLPVTGAQIQDGTITAADIHDNSVTATDILDGTITGADIQNGSLNGDLEIQDNSITTFDLADNSVDGDEVLDFGLTNQDIGVLFAQISSGGGVSSSSGSVTSLKLGTGQYEVDFARNISSCAFVATQGEAGFGAAGGAILGVTDRSGNPEAVFVTTTDDAGTLFDTAFQLIVVC